MVVFLFLVLTVRDFSSFRTHFRPFIGVHRSSTKEKSRERFRKNGFADSATLNCGIVETLKRCRLRRGYGGQGSGDRPRITRMARTMRGRYLWAGDTNYTNCHEPQQAWAHSCEFVKFVCLFLLFLAEFLESGIGTQRVPDRIKPKKGRRNGRSVKPAIIWRS